MDLEGTVSYVSSAKEPGNGANLHFSKDLSFVWHVQNLQSCESTHSVPQDLVLNP